MKRISVFLVSSMLIVMFWSSIVFAQETPIDQCDPQNAEIVCDNLPEDELPLDTPPEENTDLPMLQEPQDNEPTEYVDKGTPSLETVAGNEQTMQNSAVLGASTAPQAVATLQNTGETTTTSILTGIITIVTALFVGLISRKD